MAVSQADVISRVVIGGIKSIQRGTANLPGASSTATVTISPVDMSKTELRYLSNSTQDANASGSGGGTTVGFCSITLSSPTTILVAGSTSSNGSRSVSWELTEYY